MNDSLNNETPVITVAAIDSQAAETNIGQTINDVKFILNRTGNTSAALTVNYTLSGSAIDGLDYSPLTGRVIFAAGSSTALINIAPINDTLAEFNDPSDYYKLTLSAKSKLDVLLGGMSGNADFQWAMDGN